MKTKYNNYDWKEEKKSKKTIFKSWTLRDGRFLLGRITKLPATTSKSSDESYYIQTRISSGYGISRIITITPPSSTLSERQQELEILIILHSYWEKLMKETVDEFLTKLYGRGFETGSPL